MAGAAPLAVAQRWYEVAGVGDGVSRILESHVAPWMRCNIWLVHGRTRNLLIDTGMGLKPLKAELAALGERPLAAICTHCHFDHMGGFHEFESRLGCRNEADIYAQPGLEATCAHPWIGCELLTALPHEGYRLEDYQIRPAALTGYLDEGDVIDTGDRVFNVFHTPGHSPGSISLYERATQTLFSGDLVYDGQLIDNAWHSDPEAYRQSLHRLRELPVRTVHAGHEASFGRDRLLELIDLYLTGGATMGKVEHWLAARTKAS